MKQQLRTILIGVGLSAAAFAAAAPDTRLADAAMKGDREAVHALLTAKAGLNAAHGDGATALHWAAYNDDLQMARALLAAGGDPLARTRNGGLTPLFMACTNGNAPMIDVTIVGSAPRQIQTLAPSISSSML